MQFFLGEKNICAEKMVTDIISVPYEIRNT